MFLLTIINGFGVKPSRARFDYHISVMFMIFRRLILRCLHDLL